MPLGVVTGASLTAETFTVALAVPVSAVNRLGGQHFVYVAEQGQKGFVARQKPITVDFMRFGACE